MELWLNNPAKGKESRPRVKMSKAKRTGKLGERSPFKGFRINKRKGGSTVAKAKRKRSRRRRNAIAVYNRPRRRRAVNRRRSRRRAYRANPVRSFRRRSRSRSRRRNPPALMGLMTPVMYAAIGHVATKFAVGAVLPAINISASPPSLTSMLAKAAVAYGIAFGGEKFLGGHTFEPLFLGGMSSVIQDFVAVYIAPTVPALAGDDNFMNSYAYNALPPPSMGAYYSNDMALDETV